MKFVLCIACLMVFTMTSVCQELTLRSSTGISISKFSGSERYKEYNTFFFAPFLRFHLDKQINEHLSATLGVEYSIKGTNYDYHSPLNGAYSYIHYFGSTRLHYLIIPLGINLYSKRFILSYSLYSGFKLAGYNESLSKVYDNGMLISQTIASGKIFPEAYNKPLFGHEVGIGYRVNNNIIKLSFIKDLISIDNLNSSKILNLTYRLSYNILIHY